MSLVALSWAWRQRTGDPASKLVLVALADHHCESRDMAWPRVALIAERAEVSVSTARRKLRELEAAGWIETVPRYDDDGMQAANGYRLNLLKSSPGQIDCPGRSTVTAPPGQFDRPGRSTVTAHRTFIDPLEKKEGACADDAAVENLPDDERAARGKALRALVKSLKAGGSG